MIGRSHRPPTVNERLKYFQKEASFYSSGDGVVSPQATVTSEKSLPFQSLAKSSSTTELPSCLPRRSPPPSSPPPFKSSVISKTWSCRSYFIPPFSNSCRPQSLPPTTDQTVPPCQPPRPKVGTSLILLVPLPVIHLPRRRPGPSGARQVWERTARVRIFILMGVPTPEPVED